MSRSAAEQAWPEALYAMVANIANTGQQTIGYQ